MPSVANQKTETFSREVRCSLEALLSALKYPHENDTLSLLLLRCCRQVSPERSLYWAMHFAVAVRHEKSCDEAISFALNHLEKEIEAESVVRAEMPESARERLSRFEGAVGEFLTLEVESVPTLQFVQWCRVTCEVLGAALGSNNSFARELEKTVDFLRPGYEITQLDLYREKVKAAWPTYCKHLEDEFALAGGGELSKEVISRAVESRALFEITGTFGEPRWMVEEAESFDHAYAPANLLSAVNRAGGSVLLLRQRLAAGASREDLDNLVLSLHANLCDVRTFLPPGLAARNILAPLEELVTAMHGSLEHFSDRFLEIIPLLGSIAARRFSRLRFALLDDIEALPLRYEPIRNVLLERPIPKSFHRYAEREVSPEDEEVLAHMKKSLCALDDAECCAERPGAQTFAVECHEICAAGENFHALLHGIQEGRGYGGNGKGLRRVYTSEELRSCLSPSSSTLFALLRDWRPIGYLSLVSEESEFPDYMRRYLVRAEGELRGDCGYVSFWVTEAGANAGRDLLNALIHAAQAHRLSWIYGWCWNGNKAALAFEKAGVEILSDVLALDDYGCTMEGRLLRVRVYPSKLYQLYKERKGREYLAETAAFQ